MSRQYRAAVIGLGRMGSTFDDEMTRGGSIYLPYCHTPAFVASPRASYISGTVITVDGGHGANMGSFS